MKSIIKSLVFGIYFVFTVIFAFSMHAGALALLELVHPIAGLVGFILYASVFVAYLDWSMGKLIELEDVLS
jgi:hypothetical protein